MSDLPPDNLFHSILFAGYLPLLLHLETDPCSPDHHHPHWFSPDLQAVCPLHHKSEFLLVGSTVVQTFALDFLLKAKIVLQHLLPAPVEYNSAQGRKMSLPEMFSPLYLFLPTETAATYSTRNSVFSRSQNPYFDKCNNCHKKTYPQLPSRFFEISIHFS